MKTRKPARQAPAADSFIRALLARPGAPWLTGLGVLVFLMFADVLFASKPIILSQPDTDLFACDVPLKSFART